MLASDLANKEFMGAQNPDELLHVEFYWHKPLDWNQFQDTGQEVLAKERIPYVRIMQPGDTKSIVETPVREDHKARWPQKWLAWQMREGLIEGAGADIPGWKLEEWKDITADQVRELKHLRFSTVEQLAGASDGQVQRMGIGGIGLREKAKAALKERARAEVKAELEGQERVIEELKARDEKREREMAQMREMIQLMQVAPKPQRGRPPKEVSG